MPKYYIHGLVLHPAAAIIIATDKTEAIKRAKQGAVDEIVDQEFNASAEGFTWDGDEPEELEIDG